MLVVGLLITMGIGSSFSTVPIIAAMTAPALAIAFWRGVFGGGLTLAWALVRQRAELFALRGRPLRWTVVAGVLLGAHFATWVPSLRFTSVAASTALVATQPVWAALMARAQGRHVARQAWVGIGVVGFGAMGYAMFKFRKSKGAKPDVDFTHSTKLEIIWTVVPMLILVVMAVPATSKVMEQYTAKGHEMTVKVTGNNAVQDAIEFGVKIAGCTIHWATRNMDCGPILDQGHVRVHPGDTRESLHARINEVEKKIYPEVIQKHLDI